MSLFTTILTELENKLNRAHGQKDALARIMTEVLHTPVSGDQITLREGVVTTRVPPTIKFAIKLKQVELVARMKREGYNVISLR